MKIQNFVHFRDPLGNWVWNFVTYSELDKLFDRNLCYRWDYKLLIYHNILEFHYYVRYYAYPAISYYAKD